MIDMDIYASLRRICSAKVVEKKSVKLDEAKETPTANKIMDISSAILDKYKHRSGRDLLKHTTEFITAIQKSGIKIITKEDAEALTDNNFHTDLEILTKEGMISEAKVNEDKPEWDYFAKKMFGKHYDELSQKQQLEVLRYINGTNESKVNEDGRFGVEEQPELTIDEPTEETPVPEQPAEEAPVEEKPEEKEEVSSLEKLANDQEEKSYLGKTEADKYYYLVDNNGTLKVVDAIGEDVEEVKGIESTDAKDFLNQVTTKLNIISLDPGVVTKYVIEPSEQAVPAEEVSIESTDPAMPAEPILTPEEQALNDKEPLPTELEGGEPVEDEEEEEEEEEIMDSKQYSDYIQTLHEKYIK